MRKWLPFREMTWGVLLNLMQVSFFAQLTPSMTSKLIHQFEQKFQIILPCPSTVHDMGNRFTHKALVIRHHLEGMTVKNIAKSTFHSPEACNAYIKQFEIALLLMAHNIPQKYMPTIMRTGKSIVEQYLKLVKEYIGDTKEEIRSYLEKLNLFEKQAS